MAAKPIFILSSGRSGSYSFYNALKGLSNIEIYHEFLFDETLRNSVSYHMKMISKKKILDYLEKSYAFSIGNSKKKIWIDTSNALPWMIKPLRYKFKDAKFVFLIRDGRKVVSSFYNKYREIMYNKRDVILLKKFFDKKINFLSSEKKYWRPIPTEKKDFYLFNKKSQFSKICIYWSQLNKTIRENLTEVKEDNIFFFKLEEIENKKKFLSLLKFLGVRKKDNKSVIKIFKKPINVKIPRDFGLSKLQKKEFEKYCKTEMIKNGYDIKQSYVMKY